MTSASAKKLKHFTPRSSRPAPVLPRGFSIGTSVAAGYEMVAICRLGAQQLFKPHRTSRRHSETRVALLPSLLKQTKVARIREAVDGNFDTGFSGAKKVRITRFTVLRDGGAHANLTLAKPFPDLQARTPRRLMCAWPWPDVIEDMRPTTGKVLNLTRQ